MERSMNLEKITLGTCYYPEHWPEGMWEEDLRRMLENGIEVVRVAEFAWSKIEPREGEFTYEFFDRFLEIAERAGMKVIFCTPSMADQQIPGGAQCQTGRGALPSRLPEALQLQFSEISGAGKTDRGEIRRPLCGASCHHRLAD